MKISVFGEGPTEEKVHDRLVRLNNLQSRSEYKNANGKDNLNRKIITTLEPDFGVRPIRCIILRDLDTHDRESETSICQSFTDLFNRNRRFQANSQTILALSPYNDYTNVYTSEVPELDFRLSLHIATYRWKEDFRNSTIDDYLLELALRPHTVTHLSDELHITSEKLFAKITHELPTLLQDNGLTLDEAKNYLQMYAGILKKSSLTGFVSKILNNSDEADIREIFQPLLAAFEFVGSE